MCPWQPVADLFNLETAVQGDKKRKFEVVGSPVLQSWMKQIKEAEPRASEIRVKLSLADDKTRPVIAFMDAYDSNPEKDSTYAKVITPLFNELKIILEAKGYQVVIQPHPKIAKQVVTTPELLAVSDFVIGFNSSTIFNSLALGKKAIYVIPDRGPDTFGHLAIDKGFAEAIVFQDPHEVVEMLPLLLDKLRDAPPKEIMALGNIPQDSIAKIRKVFADAKR